MEYQPLPNSYPTPPRTSSPKDYNSFPPSTLPTPVETQSFIPPSQSYSRSNSVPAYHASSQIPLPEPYSASPPRTPAYNISSKIPIDGPYSKSQPRITSRPSSRPSSRPNSPLHRSGTPLSPYNASRPRPRQGLIKRISSRCKSLVQWLISLGKRHPILLGLATFLPVMALAIGVKVVKGVGGLFSSSKKVGAGILGDHFGDFKGLAGSKSELHGILKIVHMYANHWCKVSPSAWPRTLSILLEIFFMEHKKF